MNINSPHLKKLLIILTAILVAVLLVTIYLTSQKIGKRDKIQESNPASQETSPKISPAEVKELKIQNQMNEIIKSKDIKRCGEISDEFYKTACINNISLNLAKENQDISQCRKMDNKLISKTHCERQVVFAKSVESEDVAACQETNNAVLQKECQDNFYMRLSVKKGDISFCDQAENQETADICFNNFTMNEKLSLYGKDFDCSPIKGADYQEDCKKLKEDRNAETPTSQGSCVNFKTALFRSFCSLTVGM